MDIISTLWAFLIALWRWFWQQALTHLVGSAFVLYFIFKPLLAAVQFFRQVGAEMSGGGVYTRGRAWNSTMMRLFSDYGSAALWIVMWLTSASWLAGIGLTHPIARGVVVTVGMGIYVAFLYVTSGGSGIVMFSEFLDDAGGLGSLIAGIWLLSVNDSLNAVASMLIEAFQKILV